MVFYLLNLMSVCIFMVRNFFSQLVIGGDCIFRSFFGIVFLSNWVVFRVIVDCFVNMVV